MNSNYRNLLKNMDNNPQVENQHLNCCGNPFIESRDGNEICINCGLIFERTFVGNERRAYTVEEIQTRRRTEPRWRDFGPRTTLKRIVKGRVLGLVNKLFFLDSQKFKTR